MVPANAHAACLTGSISICAESRSLSGVHDGLCCCRRSIMAAVDMLSYAVIPPAYLITCPLKLLGMVSMSWQTQR